MDKFGTLYWQSLNETRNDVYIIEQYRWNKWVKIGEQLGLGSPGEHHYKFTAMTHDGENRFRININNSWDSITSIFDKPIITYSMVKKKKEIQFSSETLYEILDASGILVKKGWAASISYANLPKGKYILNYDNSVAAFEK
jgi:hypothetical protein